MRQQQPAVRPPPRVVPPGTAPPPRTDYLQHRYETEGAPNKEDLFAPTSPRQMPKPARNLAPTGDFDADVEREMLKLETQLRQQLEEEEASLAQLQRMQRQAKFSSEISPRSSYQQSDLSYRAEPPAVARRVGPSSINPQNMSPRNGFPIENRHAPSSEYSGSVYDGPNDKYDRIDYYGSQQQPYAQSQYATQYDYETPVESKNMFEVKLMAPKNSPPRGKGTSISRLYDDDPVRHHQEKISKQLDYNRQLQEQVNYQSTPQPLWSWRFDVAFFYHLTRLNNKSARKV
jgi:hypothetical protein